MWSRRSVVPLLLAVLSLVAAGCPNKKQPAGADTSPVSMDVASVRARYMRLNPQNRVGVVTAVRPEAHLAAVGDLPLQDFGIGDVLVFVDEHEQPFNSGEIVNATSTALHVRYDENRRAPRVGELAVRLR
jgi:hypothetical protein